MTQQQTSPRHRTQHAGARLVKGVGRSLGRRLAHFARDEDGSNSVEAMLMLPIMTWCFLATYVFFDAYRLQAINIKAGYTIGDILSRQQNYITPEFIDSMYDLQGILIETRDPSRLRVSVFSYDLATDSHVVRWSETRGGGQDLTDARLATMRNGIPEMSDGEVAIIVQTQVDYEPIFAAGIADMSFDEFVITRPRFAGQLCFNSVNDDLGTIATETC